MKLRNLLMMMLAVFSLTFAACDGTDEVVVDDGTEQPGGEDPTDEPDDPIYGAEFTITVSDITPVGALVSVVPVDAAATYYFDVIEKSFYDEYSDKLQFAEETVAEVSELVGAFGLTFQDMLTQGEYELEYTTLDPSTEYYAYAFRVDADGTVNSSFVTTVPFTTADVVPSSNTFTVTEDGGYITVTPTNNDRYVWDVMETAVIDAFTDDQIIDLVVYNRGADLSDYMAVGPSSYNYADMLTVGVSYTVVVFGYDLAPTTGLTKFEFTFEGAGDGPDSSGLVDTNITGDIDLDAFYGVSEYHGDLYGSGTAVWKIEMMTLPGDKFFLEVYRDLSTGFSDPSGTYVIDPTKSMAVGTALPGYVELGADGNPTSYGCFYRSSDYVMYAALVEGSVTVTNNNDETYSVVVDAKDSKGHKLTCDFTGDFDVYDWSNMSLPSSADGMTIKDGLRDPACVQMQPMRNISSEDHVRELAPTVASYSRLVNRPLVRR